MQAMMVQIGSALSALPILPCVAGMSLGPEGANCERNDVSAEDGEV